MEKHTKKPVRRAGAEHGRTARSGAEHGRAAREHGRSNLKREDPAFYEALGRAIKTLRAARGIERGALAEASGVSYPYLSEIENGRKRASSDALMAIAEALGVSMGELFSVAEDVRHGPAADLISESNVPAYSTRWFGNVRTDDDAERDDLKGMIDRLSPEDVAVARIVLRRLIR